MEKINGIRYLLFVIIFIFCQCGSRNENSQRNGVFADTSGAPHFEIDTSSGDTVSVELVMAGIDYYIHYYNKKPQYIRINKFEKMSLDALNYRKDNRGVFIGLSDSEDILSFGSKYLNGNEKAIFHLDSIGKMTSIEINNDYYVDSPFVIDLAKIRK